MAAHVHMGSGARCRKAHAGHACITGGIRGGETRSRFTSLSGDASALQPPTTYRTLPTMVAPWANRPAGARHLQWRR